MLTIYPKKTEHDNLPFSSTDFVYWQSSLMPWHHLVLLRDEHALHSIKHNHLFHYFPHIGTRASFQSLVAGIVAVYSIHPILDGTDVIWLQIHPCLRRQRTKQKKFPYAITKLYRRPLARFCFLELFNLRHISFSNHVGNHG